MSRQSAYDARYRANHPERYREVNRRKSARRSAASRILREAKREEYDALLDSLEGGTSQSRQEQAMRTLRTRYPDEWAEARDAVRSTDD